MYRTLFILLPICWMLMLSCTTILHGKTYEMEVAGTNETRVRYKDSVYALPQKIRVERSRKPLQLIAFNDSIQRRYTINAIYTPLYLYGNLGFIYPTGYLVDLTNPKRFYYGKKLLLDLTDTASVTIHRRIEIKPRKYIYRQFQRAGDTYLSLSVPLINTFNIQIPGEGTKIMTGAFGITGAIEHYYKANRSFELNAGAIASVIPGEFVGGIHENQHAFLISVIHKHTVNWFSFGYGLNYSANFWKRFDLGGYDDSTTVLLPTVRKHNYSIGGILSGYYHFNSFLQAGIVYRPALLTLNPVGKIQYQHTISLDCVFKLKVRRGK